MDVLAQDVVESGLVPHAFLEYPKDGLIRKGGPNDELFQRFDERRIAGKPLLSRGQRLTQIRANQLVRAAAVGILNVGREAGDFPPYEFQGLHGALYDARGTGASPAGGKYPQGMTVLLLLASIAAAGAAIYAWVFFRRYMAEREEHRRVVSLFSRYVPPPVVEELLARRDPRLFQAREYYATILVCRIRNFALFTEALSPEETLQYLNEFYTIVGQAVGRNRGMIESLRGDTVVAVFGVLLEETFQEERALRASLDIMRLIKAMESRWSAQSRRSFTVGIGVNSGKIVAGDTGFQMRREFAVVGNPADVAARLEHASEELNATVVASQSTYDVVRDLFVGVPTSSLPLRGLRRLHNAYIIRGLTKRAVDDGMLTLPSQRAFKRTVVENEALDREVAVPDAYEEPARVDAAKEPASTVDQRSAAPVIVEQPGFSFKGIEPRKAERFSSLDNDEPALPEPPQVSGTYEDDQGPPIQLPP